MSFTPTNEDTMEHPFAKQEPVDDPNEMATIPESPTSKIKQEDGVSHPHPHHQHKN